MFTTAENRKKHIKISLQNRLIKRSLLFSSAFDFPHSLYYICCLHQKARPRLVGLMSLASAYINFPESVLLKIMK